MKRVLTIQKGSISAPRNIAETDSANCKKLRRASYAILAVISLWVIYCLATGSRVTPSDVVISIGVIGLLALLIDRCVRPGRSTQWLITAMILLLGSSPAWAYAAHLGIAIPLLFSGTAGFMFLAFKAAVGMKNPEKSDLVIYAVAVLSGTAGICICTRIIVIRVMGI